MECHRRPEVKRVQDILNQIPISPATVLDYGCGQGGWIPVLENQFPEAQISGVDLSPVALGKASRKFPYHTFAVCDRDVTHFADQYFEVIFSYHVLEHVLNVERTLAEIARLLKTGGYCCLICPCGNQHSFEENVTTLVHNGKEPSRDGRIRFFYEDASHIRRLTSREVIEMAAFNRMAAIQEYYAFHSFFDATEWLLDADQHFLYAMFAPDRAVHPAARRKLQRYLWWSLKLKRLVDLSSGHHDQVWQPHHGMGRRVKRAVRFGIQRLLAPVMALRHLLPGLMWHGFKTRKNGSAMYLLFQKLS